MNKHGWSQGLAKVGNPFANAGSRYPRFPIACLSFYSSCQYSNQFCQCKSRWCSIHSRQSSNLLEATPRCSHN
jgi:hypothetical protein